MGIKSVKIKTQNPVTNPLGEQGQEELMGLPCIGRGH